MYKWGLNKPTFGRIGLPLQIGEFEESSTVGTGGVATFAPGSELTFLCEMNTIDVFSE